MDSLIDSYVEELSSDDDVKRLVELKKIIDDKYKKEILLFKTQNDKYEEALKYPEYYDMSKIRGDLSKAKKELYSKDEVVEYIKLESAIQEKLDKDFSDIKRSISSKIQNKKPFSGCNKLNK